MRILHVIQTLSPKYGGPVPVVLGLAQGQAERGYYVEIWTADDPQQSLHKANPKCISFGNNFKPLLISSSFKRECDKRLDQFDIIHIHGLYRFPVTYAAWVARKKGIPHIIGPHGSLDPFLYGQSRFGRWAVPLKRTYERLFDFPNLNHASAIHYTAREEMERAAFLNLKAPGVIVPNGIPWEEYRTLPGKGSFRKRIGIDRDTPLVLFLGRINFTKGLDLLAPSFARVLRKVPDAVLAIVGPDNEGYLRKVKGWCRDFGIMDKVRFVDHLERKEVTEAYVDADVFVLPSYTENFGLTVVEAMACGCPVVLSDQVKIWREVVEEGAGLVVSLEPSRIAEALCTVLTDKAKARAMGANGRRAAKERYDWNAIVDELIRVYQEILHRDRETRKTA
jgi:glycosyltransferase involved in cell wall biosynthesis